MAQESSRQERQVRDRGATRSKVEKCIPFTVSQSKEAMLQIVEWRFLARDEGDAAVAEDPSWGEDEEPLACVTDTWAQGSVPVVHAPAYESLEDFEEEDEEEEEEEEEEEDEEDKDENPGSPGRILLGRSLLARGSQERSPELRGTPGSQATPKLFQKAGAGGILQEPDSQARSHLFLARSSNESLRQSGEAVCVQSPLPSLELSQVASPLASAERGQPLGSYLLPEDLYPQPDATGDRLLNLTERMSLMASGVSCPSGGNPAMLSPSVSVQLHQPGRLGVPHYLAGCKATTARLDPKQLPRHWVRPQAEVVIPDSESHPLETYRRLKRRCKMESRAGPQGPVPGDRVSPAAFFPFQPNVLGASGLDPALNLGPLLPSSRAKVPFPSCGAHFFPKHSVHAEVSQSSSSKQWPSAKWPHGWEVGAEMLGKVWAGRTRVPPQGLEPADKEDQDFGWPQIAPRILEASSQVLWKPVVQPETMRLAPGVSMRNRSTQVLLSSAVPQEAKEQGTSSLDQHVIQTGMPKPEVTGPELVKVTPQVWLLPSKPMPHSDS
ncbi:uncharacterized protein C2orf81 homolog isoform X2 [Fukomys damarensis]|uniref:uncharacterized protein C2orf81 homolog isoform X2 n=1 Tax=Fukomys damarensis TaxID=885580 RepID=UPI00053FECDA|nr:uncharacterized protein C2orf81 homolog isoform X2 [Fukomys damarensis]